MDFEIVKPRVEVLYPGKSVKTFFDQQLDIIELAGRNCYKSEHRIGSKKDRDKFIRGIISRGHLSVLEHSIMTVRVIGSRSMSHQLVRHRLMAISQESQRYCNYTKEGKFGAMQIIMPPYPNQTDFHVTEGFEKAIKTVIEVYQDLVLHDAPPEDARAVLPNAAKTELVVSANFREWRHIFNMRCDKHAQWEIRGLMGALLIMAKKFLAPVFDDFELEKKVILIQSDAFAFETYCKKDNLAVGAKIVPPGISSVPFIKEKRPA